MTQDEEEDIRKRISDLERDVRALKFENQMLRKEGERRDWIDNARDIMQMNDLRSKMGLQPQPLPIPKIKYSE